MVRVTVAKHVVAFDFYGGVKWISVFNAIGTVIYFATYVSMHTWTEKRASISSRLAPAFLVMRAEQDCIFDFDTDCGIDVDWKVTHTKEVAGCCKTAAMVSFMVYAAPIAVCASALFLAVAATIMRKIRPHPGFVDDDLTDKQAADLADKLKKTRAEGYLKLLVSLFVVVVMVVYLGAMLTGGSLGLTQTVMTFMSVVVTITCIWVAKSLGRAELYALEGSAFTQKCVSLMRMNLMRAMIMCPMIFILWFVYLTGFLKQKVRRCRKPEAKDDAFPPEIQWIHEGIKEWHGGGVMTWMVLLSALLFLMGLFTKLTYIALSVLALALGTVSIPVTCLILMCTGWVIFMNPLMPGPLVYAVTGMVVCRKVCGEPVSDCSTGSFIGGVAIGVAVSLLTKLLAVIGQMFIGVTQGKNVSIQSMVGVDQPFIRAIECQLRVKGLSVGKVTILCGGPDWPTSVLCGILRVSILETCIGTTPMGIVCAPSVFAGGVLVMPPQGTWGSMKGMALLFAMASQVALGVTAVYKVNETLNSDDPAIQAILNDPRPEHQAVEELRKKLQRWALRVRLPRFVE
jgi:hypothetical protein